MSHGNTEKLQFAARPDTLDGASVAYVDLGKPNGDVLYEHLSEEMRDEFGIETMEYWKKPHFSSPMPESQIDEIVDWGADAVIEGISDCGSCNSSSVVDAVAFEQRGVPTVQIITDEFVDLNERIANSNGYDEMPIVTIEHPTRYLSQEEVARTAERIRWSVQTMLTCEDCLSGACDIGHPAERQ